LFHVIFSLLCALPIDAPIHTALLDGEQKKNPRKKINPFLTLQIETRRLSAQRSSLRQYNWRRNNPLGFFLLSPVSILSAISVSHSLYLLSHLHLPCHLHILISISLHCTEKHKIFITGANNLLRFAYSWGHRLKIVLYLAEMEIH
jgi:hypothetical protein